MFKIPNASIPTAVYTITDTTGRVVAHEFAEYEPHPTDTFSSQYTNVPPPGSVVLTQGEHGTAWQRHFHDGLWHSSRGGRAKGWAEMLAERNLVLVYLAEERA